MLNSQGFFISFNPLRDIKTFSTDFIHAKISHSNPLLKSLIMPIYEYQCQACGHLCDFLQGINAPDHTTCPACNKAALSRQISAPSFHLKGTGWYATDFKDKPKDANKNAEASAKTNKTVVATDKEKPKKG